MNDALNTIAKAACTLASSLPTETMLLVARLVRESKDCAAAKARITGNLPQPYYRELSLSFVESWEQSVEPVDPGAVSLCLLTASQSECGHRQNQSVELVWTGQDPGAVPFRRTEQALLQVLDSAKQRITLVSYAVYRIPNVADALVRAARRGVRINVVVETPSLIEGQNEYDTLTSLGDPVASCSTLYYWPHKHRPTSVEGHVGLLHVKCAVSDGKILYISSANLTQYAFTINMELGVLITGGSAPVQVQTHFDQLIALGVLTSP